MLGRDTSLVRIDGPKGAIIAQTATATTIGKKTVPAGAVLLFDSGHRLRTVELPPDKERTAITHRYIDFDAGLEPLPPPQIKIIQDPAASEECFYDPAPPEGAESLPFQRLVRILFDEAHVRIREGGAGNFVYPGDGASRRTVVVLDELCRDGIVVPRGTVIHQVGAGEAATVQLFLTRGAALGPLEMPPRTRLELWATASNVIMMSGEFSEDSTFDSLCAAPRSWTLFRADGLRRSRELTRCC